MDLETDTKYNLLVAGADGHAEDIVTTAAGNWRIAVCAAPDAYRQAADIQPHLIVFRSDADATDCAAKIRQAPLPLASVAMVSEGRESGGRPSVDTWDGVIEPASREVLASVLFDWMPVSMAAHQRVVSQFGADAIDPLRARLRETLQEGLRLIEVGEAIRSDRAHRLAGICGMLGFEATGAFWRDVFEGDESRVAYAWRLSRLTIAAIDRHAVSQLQH